MGSYTLIQDPSRAHSLVTATRTTGEKEDAEADRLVRQAPKKKPPRHDRRREQMKVDRDTDTEDDPDLNSKDRSMNYKTIGGSIVERLVARYAAEGGRIGRIPARNRETGKIVFVSEKALRENPQKYEKYKPEKKDPPQPGEKPKPPRPRAKPKQQATEGEKPPEGQKPKRKKRAPKEGEKPPEAPPEPAIAGDAPPPEAKPPEGSEPEKPEEPGEGEGQDEGKDEQEPEEQAEPAVAQKLGIQPPKRREATAAERSEAALMLADHLPPELAAQLIASGIHPDDAKTLVGSYRAAKERPTGNLEDYASKAAGFFETDPDRVQPPQSWRNAEGKKVAFDELSPDEKATAYRQHQMQVVAASLAAQHQLEDKLSFGGDVPPMVSKVMTRALLGKVSDGAAPSIGEKLFELASSSKDFAKISDGQAQKMLASVKGSKGAQALLKSYLQANDYKRAKNLYLHDKFSERDKPTKILEGLEAARDFFKVQGRSYGDEKGHEGAKHFETKVLGQLRELNPDKYKVVRRALDERDAQEYRQAQRQYRREVSAYERAHKAWQKDPFGDVEPQPPKEPVEPIGYSNAKNSGELASEGKDLWKDLEERAATTKTAAHVASKFLISSYPSGIPMHRTSTSRAKDALYHGIAPGVNYQREPYPGWGPVPTRDLSEVDHVAILAAAKIWLNAPISTDGAKDMVPDQKYRQALDLALSDGHYKPDIQTYNELLARLQGAPAPGLDQSALLTKHADAGRSRLERAVYAKFPPDSKRKAGGKPTVMLTGTTASKLRRPDFSLVALSELTMPELETLAKTIHVVTSSFDAPQGDNRKPDNGARQMLRLSSEQKTSANQILASFDQLAQSIQENYRKWGMTQDVAKKLVNHLDRTADAAETFFFGENSLRMRQAEIAIASEDFRSDAVESGLLSRAQVTKAARVIQRDSDEPYMDTFKNPMAPIDTNADEPYMSAYGDDQSSAVVDGEDDTGRELAPEA